MHARMHGPFPEIPFMSHYPEWNLLLAEGIEVSPEAEAVAADRAAELKRTLSTLYAFDNLYKHRAADDPGATGIDLAYVRIEYASTEAAYQAFTDGQNLATQLPREKYDDVKERINSIFNTPEIYKAKQFFLLISDTLKDPALRARLGFDPQTISHDQALKLVFTPEYEELCQEFFPTLFDASEFSDEDRTRIYTWASCMGFNLPGWAQSQSSVGHLEQLPANIDKETLKEFLMHGALDVMGVMGNKSLTSALAYTEPTHDMLMTAIDALTITAAELGWPEDTVMTPQVRENLYLAWRAEYYGVPISDYQDTMRRIEVPEAIANDPAMAALFIEAHQTSALPELRAQVQLANMARYSPEQFAVLREAYNELPLDVVGNITAFLEAGNYEADYGPASIGELIKGNKESIKKGLVIIARLLQAAQEEYGHFYYEATRGIHASDEGYSRASEFTANITLDCKELASLVRNPDSDIGSYAIIIKRKGTTFIPRLVTPEEKLEYICTKTGTTGA